MADDDGRARRTTRTGAPLKKAAAGRISATKAQATKSQAAKAPVKRAPVGAAKKAAVARKAVARKAVAKKAATTRRSAPGTVAPTRKAPAPVAERGGILSPRPRKAPAFRPAAERTFADDLPPASSPEPARDDPNARVRAVLRAAAVSLGQRDPVVEEPAPRVLVGRVGEEAEDEWVVVDEDLEEDEDAGAVAEELEQFDDVSEFEEIDEVEDEEWGPPEVLEEAPPIPAGRGRLVAPAPPPPPPPPAPPVSAPPERPAGEAGAGGGMSVLAIVLAVILPLIGAVIGLVLSGRARRNGARLAGAARAVSLLALVGWVVGGGVFGYLKWSDQGVDYSKLKVGDCFNSASSNEIRGIKVKPCSEPHDSEIFFLVEHPGGPEEPYPGKEALVQYAADACLGQPLTDYLGVPLAQSTLKDFEIVPQQSAWEDGRRVLVCGLDTGGQGAVTGSVKGTRR